LVGVEGGSGGLEQRPGDLERRSVPSVSPVGASLAVFTPTRLNVGNPILPKWWVPPWRRTRGSVEVLTRLPPWSRLTRLKGTVRSLLLA
jgi:hypothetical protein